MANSRLEERVIRAAETTLAERSYVSAIDVLLRLGWLAPPHLDLWRQGRVECLERMVQASLGKQSTAMRTLHTWATRRRLTPSETAYLARTRDRRRVAQVGSASAVRRTSNWPTARTGCPPTSPPGRPSGCALPRTSRRTWLSSHR
jgi:hypothetical protein